MNNKPIGIFDSGLGGLTILKQVRKLLPKENIIYFGDTAHVPYGSKSKETVTEYSVNIAKFLEQKGVKFILIACNTASSLALPAVKKCVKIPVLGVIEPGAKAAVKRTKNNKVLLLGTQSTIRSKAYAKTLKKLNKKIAVLEKACPLFVPLIEEGLQDDVLTDLTIKKYLASFKKSGVDAVILGCTHYPLIKDKIGGFFGKNAAIVDSSQEVARETRRLLENKNCLKTNGKGKVQIYLSDKTDKFAKLAQNIMGVKLPEAKVKKLCK
jgi:glutamate racemase